MEFKLKNNQKISQVVADFLRETYIDIILTCAVDLNDPRFLRAIVSYLEDGPNIEG